MKEFRVSLTNKPLHKTENMFMYGESAHDVLLKLQKKPEYEKIAVWPASIIYSEFDLEYTQV